MHRSVAVSFSLAVFAACTPLEPTKFTGEPLIIIRGNARPTRPSEPAATDPVPARLGVFWNPNAPAAYTAFEELLEQPSIGKALDLPNSMEWAITEEPKAEHFATTAGGAKFALGRLFAYDDANANGQWDSGEKMLATGPLSALYFAPEEIPAADSPTGHAMPKGYVRIGLPLNCPPHFPEPVHEGDCGVPLGAFCTGDGGCTGGRCLSAPPAPGSFPFPGGYCAIEENAQTTCRPTEGRLWTNHRDQTLKFWMKACTQPSDCVREGAPFHCDFSRGACMPLDADLFLPNSGMIVPGPYCLGPP